MSVLTKTSLPSSPGSPGVPGVPGHYAPGVPATSPKPAYCQNVSVYYPMTYGYITGFDNNGQFFMIPYSKGPQTVTEEHCYPATPGSPGVPGPYVPGVPGIPPIPAKPVDYQVGWNASARSVASLDGDGQYQFSVSSDAVGVVTGLNDADNGSNYVEIDYAIYCATGQFRILEGGADVGVSGRFSLADVFAIARVGDVVQYFQNGTLLYSSKKLSTGTVFADSSLYFGGDRIIDAAFSEAVDAGFLNTSGGFDGVLTGLRGYFSDTGAAAWRNDVLGNMTGSFHEDGNQIAQLTGVLPSMQGQFVTPDARALMGVMDGLRGYFESGLLQPSFSAAALTLQSMSGFTIALAGITGVLTGGLGNLRGFMSNAPPGGYLLPGDPPPIRPGTGGGSSFVLLYHDTFTGSGTADLHTPEVGVPYVNDGCHPIEELSLTGSGGLPIGDDLGNGYCLEQPLDLTGLTSVTVKQIVQLDAVTAGVALYVDTALDKVDTDDWLYETYLDVQLDGTIHLSGYVYALDGSTLYSAAEEPDVTVRFTLGVPHTIKMIITPSGVVWTLDDAEIDNSGGVLSDTPLATCTGVETDIRNGAGGGTHGFIDESEVVVEAIGISAEYDIDSVGDWIGRSGSQLRMLTGFFLDKEAMGAGDAFLASALVLPHPLLVDASVSNNNSRISFDLTLPAPLTMQVEMGWTAEVVLPLLVVEASGTIENMLRADLTLPMLLVEAEGTLGTVLGTPDLRPLLLPMLEVDASVSGESGRAALTLPMLQVSGRITTDLQLSADLRLPLLRVAASVVSALDPAVGHLQGHLVLPALRMANSVSAAFLLPLLRVSARLVSQDIAAQARIGYAMNLKTGAVTEYANYPFRAMARAYNGYWGVGLDGNLYRMGGDLDDTAAIAWEWQSGLSDFGVWGMKGVKAVYVQGEFENGATVTFVTDDTVRTYDHVAKGAYNNHQTHRVPIGRGVRTTNMAFGMANTKGGYLELDKVTPEYVITPRNL